MTQPHPDQAPLDLSKLKRPDHGPRKMIAVYHAGTGRIRHTVLCFEKDQGKQHIRHQDHHWKEVPPGTHANHHQIDIATGAVIARVQTLEEAKDRATRNAVMACEHAIHAALHGPGDFVAGRSAALARIEAVKAQIAAGTDIATVTAITF